ncbi:hypothetical protein DPMN_054905 [Dreissena polymorpha]|uniref:Uncharacterized protein n=1 Tax=Dreissena polymorpha TaxID=45954 RepID=A0A9D4CPS2_DREPO|nr:hypothetical protein DPMN_054905 [Dreissena polymorpha]
MDTQRGGGDMGLGGQQTTFHPLDAQPDQADTRLYIQRTTFHPDVTPTTLENRNTHALHYPVDTSHLTECEECDGASCDQIHSLVVTCKTTTPGTSASTQTTTLRTPATTQKTRLGTPAITQTTTLGTPATKQTTTIGTPSTKQTMMGKLSNSSAPNMQTTALDTALSNSTPNTQTTELLAPPTKHIVIPTHLNMHPASTQGISSITHSTQPGVDTTVMPSSSSTTRRITTPLGPGHYTLLQVATQCAVGMEPTYPSSANGNHELRRSGEKCIERPDKPLLCRDKRADRRRIEN